LLLVNVAAGATGLPEFLREMYRLELKPSLITVSGPFDGFEKALQPVLADKVDQMSRTAAIRGPDRLTPEARSQIDAAIPVAAVATPKKQRRLLVLDLNIAYNGHQSIPAENYALEQMGKRTGAYRAVFDNNLDNLKYEKIRQFDAVYLNYTPQFTHQVVLRDWQLSGTATAYTGPPFTPKVANYDITTGGAARPNRVAKGTLADQPRTNGSIVLPFRPCLWAHSNSGLRGETFWMAPEHSV
jgi:hypothetical protein